MTELCLEYRIYDLQLWNGLLQKLLGFNMVRLGTLPWSVVSSSGPDALQQLPAMLATERMPVRSPWLRTLCEARESADSKWGTSPRKQREGERPGLVWYLWMWKRTAPLVLMEEKFDTPFARIWYFMWKFSVLVIFGTFHFLFIFPQIPYLRKVLTAISSIHALWQVCHYFLSKFYRI